MCAKPKESSTDEIDITPAMIEAGLSELYAFGPDGPCSGEEVVKDIFIAMTNAAKRSSRKIIFGAKEPLDVKRHDRRSTEAAGR